MGTELLTPQEKDANATIGEEQAKIIGGTAFEALAVDTGSILEAPDSTADLDFTNSLTRIPGGQTVPDER